jgi:hypothetical protein
VNHAAVPALPAVPSAADAFPSSPDARASSAVPPPANGPITAAPAPFDLKIEAGKATRVIVETDGYRVFDGNMKAGESRTFMAHDEFQVSARDAGALLLELNGKKLAPIGPAGQAGKVTLTREALKGAVGGNH